MPQMFDEEAIYDQEIAPLMDQIIEICKRQGIPVVAVFQFSNDPENEDAGFCTTVQLGEPGRANAHMEALGKVAGDEVRRREPFAMAITETKTPDGITHLRFQKI